MYIDLKNIFVFCLFNAKNIQIFVQFVSALMCSYVYIFIIIILYTYSRRKLTHNACHKINTESIFSFWGKVTLMHYTETIGGQVCFYRWLFLMLSNQVGAFHRLCGPQRVINRTTGGDKSLLMAGSTCVPCKLCQYVSPTDGEEMLFVSKWLLYPAFGSLLS